MTFKIQRFNKSRSSNGIFYRTWVFRCNCPWHVFASIFSPSLNRLWWRRKKQWIFIESATESSNTISLCFQRLFFADGSTFTPLLLHTHNKLAGTNLHSSHLILFEIPFRALEKVTIAFVFSAIQQAFEHDLKGGWFLITKTFHRWLYHL